MAALFEDRSESELSASKALSADTVAAVFRKVSQNATPVSGTIAAYGGGEGQSAYDVKTIWSQPDIDRKEKTTFTKSYTLLINQGQNDPSVLSSTTPQEVNNVLWDVLSPSETKRAVIIKQKDKKGEDKQYLEIWDTRQKIKTVDLKALDIHGDVVGSGQFGCLSWSRCEESLLYVADRKKPKTASFFDAKPADEKKDKGDTTEDVPLKGGEFLYRESWGEQLGDRHVTVICRLNWKSGVGTVLTNVPDDCSPGQAVWGPAGEVVFVGWCHEPFRLGLIYCTQRKSYLFKATFDGECEKLSEEGRSVRCPSFSPDYSRLVYLDTPANGAHNQCSRLMMIDWKKAGVAEGRTVVVDIVTTPANAEPYDSRREVFTGLFSWSVQGSHRCWLGDGVHFLMTSQSRSTLVVLAVNTDSGRVTRICPYDKWPFREVPLPPRHNSKVSCARETTAQTGSPYPNEGYGWDCSLLDVRGNDVLISCSWFNKPHFLVFGHLNPDMTGESRWALLDKEGGDSVLEKCFDWQVFVIDPKTSKSMGPACDYLEFDATLILPKSHGKTGTKPPLILFPHGGPHSAFSSSFQVISAVFSCCGFAVLLVNYRGSLGFGQDSIKCLPGNIGDFDVKDCMLALERVHQENVVDVNNTFVYGGSHGGFLTAHLIGQYPNQFQAASLRNPVINLPAMLGVTDIKDWVFYEGGFDFDFKNVADDKVLPKLYNSSPIRFIDQTKTPVMLSIGLKDARVPPSQGLEYYKMLKARGVPVQCHTYPDSCHPLAEVEVAADSLVNSVLWFAKHLADPASK